MKTLQNGTTGTSFSCVISTLFFWYRSFLHRHFFLTRHEIIIVTLFRAGFFTRTYLTVADLIRLGISVRYVSIRSPYLVRFLSLCWITGGYTIHPPIEGLFPPTSTEPAPFQISASKVAGLRVHATTPSWFWTLPMTNILSGKAKKIISTPTSSQKYRVKVDYKFITNLLRRYHFFLETL